ncbi:neural cell adhesion molecule 2-like [Glandiceps talaboti]
MVMLYISVCQSQDLAITPPDDKYLEEGGSFSYTCATSGINQAVDPKWYDPNNNQIYELGQGGSQSRYVESNAYEAVLYFEGMIETYSGTYTCKAVNQAATVKVFYYRKITFVNAPEKQYVVVGKDGFIDCAVTGSPTPTVTWKFNNNDLPNNERYVPTQQYGLGIQDVTLADEGTYTCRARQPTLGNTKKVDITLDVQVPPTITQPPRNTTGDEGKSGRLTCRADGDPNPNIRWLFKNVDLHNPIKYQFSDNNRTMVVQNLKEEDSGAYTCRAENPVGWDEGIGHLTVNVIPVIGPTQNFTKIEQSFVAFKCTVIRGTPYPTMRWRKGPKVYTQGRQSDNERINVQYDERQDLVLTINELNRFDIGTYTCVAENTAGYDQEDFHLDVEYAPVVDIGKTKKTQKSWVGNPTNITCTIMANPPAQFTWSRIGRPLNTTNYKTFNTENKTSLFIIPEPNDFADYRCRGVNNHGNDFYTVTLERTSTPQSPEMIVESIYPDSVVLSYVDPADTGGWPIDGYKVVIKQGPTGTETEYTYVKGEQIDVTGLMSVTTYMVKLACHNPVGYSAYSDYETFTTLELRGPYEPEITTAPSTQMPRSYNLEWKKPRSGGSDIQYYQMRYRELYFTEDGKPAGSSRWSNEKNKLSSDLVAFMIVNLKPETHYELDLWAVNNIAPGDVNNWFFTTGRAVPTAGPTKHRPGDYTITPAKRIGAKGLSTGAIIGIVIAIFFVLLILVDVTCYFMNDCGILMCLCVNLCGKHPPDDRDAAELEEGRKYPLEDGKQADGLIPVKGEDVAMDSIDADKDSTEKPPPEESEESEGKEDVAEVAYQMMTEEPDEPEPLPEPEQEQEQEPEPEESDRLLDEHTEEKESNELGEDEKESLLKGKDSQTVEADSQDNNDGDQLIEPDKGPKQEYAAVPDRATELDDIDTKVPLD